MICLCLSFRLRCSVLNCCSCLFLTYCSALFCSTDLTFRFEGTESNGDKPGGCCQKSRECRSGEEQSHKSPTPGGGPDEYRRAVKSILIYLIPRIHLPLS